MTLLEPYMQQEDDRGSFTGIINSGRWEEFNYVETKAGQTRGGHYHSETKELFFILDGDIEITVVSVHGNQEQSCRVKKNSIIIVDAGEIHTFKSLTASKWINALSKKMDAKMPDFHRRGEQT
jgi:mannose-6-phosphate isomerase-like protein (cupin superfamily)